MNPIRALAILIFILSIYLIVTGIMSLAKSGQYKDTPESDTDEKMYNHVVKRDLRYKFRWRFVRGCLLLIMSGAVYIISYMFG